MNCTEFKTTLNERAVAADVVNGKDAWDGAGAEQATFDAHWQSCAACGALYESALTVETEMLAVIRKMPVPDASAGFTDRVLNAAVVANTEAAGGVNHPPRHGFVLGFGSAAVAGLALWVVVGLFPERMSPMKGISDDQAVAMKRAIAEKSALDSISIVLHQQQDIKLAFFSGESLKGAKITIQLPEHVALAGYPGRRQLSWATDLKKGDNVLRLPVIATHIARGDLVANIEYQGQVKTLTLGLAVNAADTSRGTSMNEPQFELFVG